MKIYEYKDYDEYKKIQTEANVKKLNNVWVGEDTIKNICKIVPEAKFVLCHGVRNGAEVNYFKKYLPDAVVLGTEISHTATQFPYVVEWDFHEVNEDWLNTSDIVYSNSFDHSYDPVKCLKAWLDQTSKDGFIFLEHCYGVAENVSKATDPLEISKEEIKNILREIGAEIVNEFQASPTRKRNSRIYQICRSTS